MIPAEPREPAASTARRLRGPIGVATALALAFVWGGLAYREVAAPRGPSLAGEARTAVRGSEAPPGWVGDFATAFCTGDAPTLASRLGPPLTADVAAIEQALSNRESTCANIRFIGGGANPQATFYVYVTRDDAASEQWWVFTVVGERVVAID